MKTRGTNLWIQFLLMIIITAIVTYSCMNLAELLSMYTDVIQNTLSEFHFGF